MTMASFGLAVDPGKRRAGVTVFDPYTKTIVKAGLVKADGDEEGPAAAVKMARAIFEWANAPVLIDQLVVEWPRTYEGRAAQGDANDLFTLAALDGALAMRGVRIAHYLPQEWGALGKPKTVKEKYAVERRVCERLSEKELLSITWPTNIRHTWDVTDSLAIALKHLGRFERARAFARE